MIRIPRIRILRAIKAGSLAFLLIGCSACVSIQTGKEPSPSYPAPSPRPAPLPVTHRDAPRADVQHQVAPGETLWRISRMYDVPMAALLSANHLSSENTPIQLGEKLVIPNAAPLQPVISLFPSTKWEYIVVHHSATEEGSSLAFHKSHLDKGWDRGVGYHFVIDNGTNGKGDGQVEVTPRWIKQEDGAHCKADGMNERGIGICLVGNFSQEQVAGRQMDALVDLVVRLKNYYLIPDSKIIGHRHAQGATTECPGSRFPWEEFKRRVSRGY